VTTTPNLNAHSGPGTVGLSATLGHYGDVITSTVHTVELCAVLAGALRLKIIGAGGAPLGDPHSWERRRNITADAGHTFTITPQMDSSPLKLRALITAPLISYSRSGNPIITPTNQRVDLALIIGDLKIFVDPNALINTLVEHGVIIRFDDDQGFLTRHNRPPQPAFEVWPNQQTTQVTASDQVTVG
jgi:hypothetical protein